MELLRTIKFQFDYECAPVRLCGVKKAENEKKE